MLYQNIERMGALNLTVEGMKWFILSITQEVADEKQKLECKHYGTFMTNLSRSSLEALFWVPFTAVFVLLILAAISHQKSERTYMHGKHHPEDKLEIKSKQRRWRVYSVLGTMLATFLVIGCIISKLLLVVRSHIARSINSSGFIGACGPSHKLDPSLPSLESLSTSGRAWESTALLRGMWH